MVQKKGTANRKTAIMLNHPNTLFSVTKSGRYCEHLFLFEEEVGAKKECDTSYTEQLMWTKIFSRKHKSTTPIHTRTIEYCVAYILEIISYLLYVVYCLCVKRYPPKEM